MAILRMKDIRSMNEKDLEEKLRNLRLELAKERANINVGASVSSPGKIREIRRSIARILTVKRERRSKHA
jgi:large subunit ribosomal protein L29